MINEPIKTNCTDFKSNFFTDDDIEYYFKRFNLIDKDGSGKISREEFLSIKSFLERNSWGRWFDSVAGKDGFIDCKEFLTILENQEIEELFDELDVNESGCISLEELYRGVQIAAQNRVLRQAKEILDEADTNGDGCISFKEFKKYMQSPIKK